MPKNWNKKKSAGANSSYEPSRLSVLNDELDSDNEENDISANSSSPMIPDGHLPMYLADAFGELYEEDGLMVMGKGLGCLLLLATFVRFYADTEEGHAALLQEEEEEEDDDDKKKRPGEQKHAPKPNKRQPFVFVLGLHENERKSLINILQSWGTPPEWLPTILTNEAGQAKDRQMLYARAGVFCITSRILITDLLTNVVTANEIDGILVFHADQITQESTEAFILRIFHSQKQPQCSGFVKGFSESAENLLSGFAKVDKVLKALRVRRLYLYPRFQEAVRQELEARPPLVTELHQPLSPLQKEIQQCIVAAVQACVRELKQSTTKLEWSDADLSIENCVTTNFDRAISRQLEHEWHKLTPLTKQLIQDLKTLRTLFQALLHYDCVTFYKLLNNIKSMSAASRNPSMWLLTPAADVMFRKAKERVYVVESPADHEQQAKLVTVLEENPKWKLLRKVLDEIKQEANCRKDAQEQVVDPYSVLVMVKDDRTLDAVKSYLTGGKRQTLPMTWLRFLEHHNDRSRSLTNGPDGMAVLSEERRLLLEEESRVRRILFGQESRQENQQQKNKKTLNQVPAYLRKRRRVAVEKGRGDLVHNSQADLDREAVLDDAIEEMEHELNNLNKNDDKGGEEEEEEEELPGNSRNTVSRQLEQSRLLDEEAAKAMFRVTNPAEFRVLLRSYSGLADGSDDNLLVLQDIRPTHIVFYDMDVAFIRSVEIYASLSSSHGSDDSLKIYFLVFEASSEEKVFRKALEREQSAFERLIQHKISMPPPMLTDNTVTQELQEAQGSFTSTYMDGTLPLAFDSRKGQGKANHSKRRRDIAVDVREFRSALPSILHQGGMRLAPVTLTVGDYVLSHVHCVERKSISDLYGSFASGRLYTQVEAMCKYYKAPCLLIEFDPSKSFCLQNPNELGLDIKLDSACSKLSLLCMHFPSLRVLWSKGPHETLKIFQDLKKNHDEVNVDHAMEVGRNESLESLFEGQNNTGKKGSAGDNQEDQEEEEDEVNEIARDMLLRIPGVTVEAARRVMERVESLKELSGLPRNEVRRIAGPVAGQKIFTFFQQQQTESH